MKKSLVALAALAVAGVASAQSSVTLFGVVDASVSHYSSTSRDDRTGIAFSPVTGLPVFTPGFINQGSAKTSATKLANSGYNSSRLGFRGTEDLGGGLAASFWLEAPISNDDGQTGVSTFARRSTVSLSGGFGEVRLGRDYTATFWNDTVFDPFGTNGVGTNLIFTSSVGPNAIAGSQQAVAGTGVTSVFSSNYVRAPNMVAYFLPPNLGGFYGQVQYAFSEKTSYSGANTPATLNQSRAGKYVGGRFGYANGPLDVAVAYGSSTVGDNFYAGITTKTNTANLGASYDFGPVKLFGEFSKLKNKNDYEVTPLVGTVNDIDITGLMVGVTVPVGAGLIRASYGHVKYDYNLPTVLFGTDSSDPKADQLAIGYVHNLSKRTALYATVARIKNKNGAALAVQGSTPYLGGVYTPRTSTGYDFGIRHSF
jgi:predicted porin